MKMSDNTFIKQFDCFQNTAKKQEGWDIPFLYHINPIQDGGKKASSTSFSPVTSANVGVSPKNFLTFSYNPFAIPV